MNNIKISIIVPVSNTEKYLCQCLDSILHQTLHEIEVICVDDGSSDNSPQILKKYEKEDTRLKVFLLGKTSIGTARNYGIEKANGEYIGFVDSDDFIDPSMYEILYQTAKKSNAQIAITNINLYYSDTGRTILYRDASQYEAFQKRGVFSAREYPKIIQSVGIWDKLYQRDFLLEYHLKNPENIVFEDHLFSFQALVLASRIVVVNMPLYFYRKNLSSSITGMEVKNDEFKMDYLKISFMIRDFLYKNNSYSYFYIEFVKYLFTNALWHQSNITNFEHFKQFFTICRNTISSQEMKTAHKMLGYKIKLYVLALKYNLYHSFYLACLIKNAIRSYKQRRISWKKFCLFL